MSRNYASSSGIAGLVASRAIRTNAKRLRSLTKDHEVTFIGGDGRLPNGRTLLRNVRASYGG